MRSTAFGGLAALMLAGGAIAAQGPHQHGHARLELALESGQLHVALAGPLESFVGFEHRPRNADERVRLDDALALLREPARWLTLPAAAGCAADEAHVAPPFGEAGPSAQGHAEVRVELSYSCASPDRLEHIELALFKRFTRLHVLRALVVGPAGQSLAELNPRRPRLELK